MSYHDEQMRKRCEESGTHPATSDGKLRNDSCELVAHGDRFVYASEYEALEADNAKLDAELAEHKETLSEWHDSFHALEADNATLRGELVRWRKRARENYQAWANGQDEIVALKEDAENAKLREQLAKAQR